MRGGALILDRCRAFDLFASVDAHLCSMPLAGYVQYVKRTTNISKQLHVCRICILYNKIRDFISTLLVKYIR